MVHCSLVRIAAAVLQPPTVYMQALATWTAACIAKIFHHAHLLPAVKSVLDRTKPASDNLWAKYNAMLHDPVVVSPLNSRKMHPALLWAWCHGLCLQSAITWEGLLLAHQPSAGLV